MTSERPPEDADLLAAEFALGLLTGDDLDEARRLVSEDRAFARSVADWEVRLAALAEDLPAEPPRTSVKEALLARLFPEPARAPFWHGSRVWQAVSALCLLALAAFVLTDFAGRTGPEGPLYSAEIVAEEGDFRVVAVLDKSTDEVILTRTAGAAPDGRILQVWAHGEGEPAMSVGLWPDGESVRLPMPPTIAAVEGVLTLGVSEEPPGGSPTGSPSGRVFGTVDIPGVSGTF